MIQEAPWGELQLTDEATLLLGSRPRPGSKSLEAGRIELAANFARSLIGAGNKWLFDLRMKAAVPYIDDPHLEAEEYLLTSVSALVSQALASRASEKFESEGLEESETIQQASDLQSIVSGAFENSFWLSPDNFRQPFLFYAIVIQARGGNNVAFIKQASPRRVAKPGGWLTVFNQQLELLDRPVFILEPDVDLIVFQDTVAILRPLAFERLFSDLELSERLMAEHIQALTRALPFKEEVVSAVEAAGRRLSRTRRLLREVSAFTTEQWQARTPERIAEILAKRNLKREDFLDEEGNIVVTEINVPTFVEVLASRYFTSDFDQEEMRADKVRRRT